MADRRSAQGEKNVKNILAALMMLVLPISSALAADPERGTPAEAQALLKKAVAHYKKFGKEKALADFVRKDGGFIDRDLYVAVYDLDGVALAHINSRYIGKNVSELRDANGKYYVRDRMEAARKEKSGWQDLAGRINPVTKKMEDKRMYWERHDDLVFAAGAYKPK
jgi:signal transduction histidine kinase